MRVKEINSLHVRNPPQKANPPASPSPHHTDNLIVRVTLDNGVQGFGEGVPREYVTGETIDSALALLNESGIAEQLEDCPTYKSAVAWIEHLRLAPVAGDERKCRGNSARCA